jgi:prepilin-type N-terminal cleavage/methylation domain-containing protein
VCAPSAGFTLVEVMIALVIIVLALQGFSQSIVSSMVAADADADVRRATEGGRQAMEQVKGANFEDIFALYNDDPSDDGDVDDPANNPALGSNFDIPGLSPVDGDPDGSVGKITLPIVLDGATGEAHLREDVKYTALGLPRDLDGDGIIDAADHGDYYLILPVIVRVEWQGASGPSYVEFKTLLSGI